MLKSKTRRRVAAKTAAIGIVGAGILLGAVPAIASLTAAPKPVSYTCTPTTGTAVTNPYKLQMDLSGPLTSTPGSVIVVTWKLGQPGASPFLVAPSAIAAGDRLSIEADVVVTGSPLPSSAETRTVTTSATPGAVAANGTLPLPSVMITVTPTATGVIAVQPDAFTLIHNPGTAVGSASTLYDCVIANQAEATAAALMITVKPSGATTGTGTPTSTSTGSTGTPTATPTPTYTTPEPTVTVTHTKTSKPTSKPRKTGQIGKTPGGGASTGGGGEAGPDARMIVLGGTALVAAAGAGGLVLRRRTATRG
ncbi:hypothetical protein AB0395_19645 [Streptosporangium sp. NPDC051023]|uniref:hypothetical protein n=1 Tax=Streptosporangium sp. NPDC051023 TaxID=3155410 RepID=UPI00344F0C1A